MNKLSFRFISFLIVLCTFALPALAQKVSRDQLFAETTALRQQIAEKEAALLAPDPEDLAKFAAFEKGKDGGIIRILPRGVYDKVLTMRGGGAYYSFANLTNEYNYDDVALERGYFTVGFAGADYGFIESIGAIPLEKVILEDKAVQSLARHQAARNEPDARAERRNSYSHAPDRDSLPLNRSAAQLGQTYVVRSINFEHSDILAAFRVVRADSDGSLILIWKMLKRYPTPTLRH